MSDIASVQRGVEDLALDPCRGESHEYAGNKEPPRVDDVSPLMLQQNEGSFSEEDKDMEESEDEEDFDPEAFKRMLLKDYNANPGMSFCSECVPNEVCKSCRHLDGRFPEFKPTCCRFCGNPDHEFGYCSGCKFI